MWKRWKLTLLFLLAFGMGVAAQTLSEQVLQLLTRANTWTALQTYNAAIKIPAGVPADTTLALYSSGGNLFWNGAQVAGSGSATAPHNILSTTHPDTTPATVVRGDLMTGQVGPVWARLALGASGTVLQSNGTDAVWVTLAGAGLVSSTRQVIAGAGLTGGGDLTADRTFDVGAGTGLTVNANDVALTIPVVAANGGTGQTTYAIGDLLSASGATTLSRVAAVATGNVLLSAGVATLPAWGKVTTAHVTPGADDTVWISNGTAFVASAIPNCVGATSALNYTTATNTVSCGTVAAGTVTSAALSMPGIFSVAGSPITTTGTFSVTLATQTANTVFAGPASAGPSAPTFRALVNADLPLTGVGAGTYSSVTVNTAGVVTAGSANQSLTTVTGTLGIANGGTGQTAIGDDNVWVGSAATTVAATAIPNCVGGALGYATATNLFSCTATVIGAASVTTFTNKTYDAEGTGNLLTVPFKEWKTVAVCIGGTPGYGPGWSAPAANSAAQTCVTGANTQKGVLDFADGATTLSAQYQAKLPADWVGNIDVQFWWYTSATAGNVVWQIASTCVANAETGDPAFSAASTVTDAAHGVANQYNVAPLSAIGVATCAADEVLYLNVFRDPTNGSDTLAATARLVGVELTMRRAM